MAEVLRESGTAAREGKLSRLSRDVSSAVIPAKAGIHFRFHVRIKMDPGFRRDDGDAERCARTITETPMSKKTPTPKTESPSKLIDARIRSLGDWRGGRLAQLRALVHEADPDVVETWKWRGVPVWEHDGILCTGETYKSVVKLTFAKGASLDDPKGLFNSSLEGNTRRAIDFREDDKVNASALKALIRAAVKLNTAKVKPKKR
jgi:hypothetical protein